jgi:glycosyltransferase involved in cell wall biosynthesis
MRVLFLNDLWDQRIGSSVRQMYQHAEELRARGHEVLCFSTTPDPKLVGKAEELGIPLIRVHSDYNPRWRAWVGLNNAKVVQELKRVLAEFRPDIVHTHLIHTHISYAALTAAKAAGARVVFTAHDVMTFCYQKLTCFHGGEAARGELRDYAANWRKCIPCKRLRYRPGRNGLIRKVLERDVDRLTVVSDELGDVLRANGLPVHRRVHNAIRLQDELPAPEAVAAFRAARGLGQDPVIAIGGRLHEQKGVGQLFHMLKILLPEFPALKVMVMGKRDVYDREFAAQATELGVDHAIVPTGWLDGEELQCAYSAVDVFVTPSICFDTFGLVNLEAMEHSRPVVATTFGGSQEVVQHGLTGAIANPFDVPGFAEEIAKLLRDPARAQAMGQAGRKRLENHFTIPRLADEFMAEYEAALD